MNNDKNNIHYSDSIIVKPFIEQQDDEIKTDSNKRRIRVKFAYSFDNDKLLPMTQTTIIKSEPYFKVTSTEDDVTKHFYKNEFIKQRTLSETDSLEDEYSSKLIKNNQFNDKQSSSSIKSILKKPQIKKKEEDIFLSSQSRSPSPRSSSSKKKEISSSTRLDFNQVQHLAEITSKQNSSPSSVYNRSLFDQTINIFDPNNSHRFVSNTPRPSRLQYYIKPYRGEANHPIRSRSLSQNKQSENKVRWYTFTNQYPRPLNRKQHVSWSPVREYIHQGRDNTTQISNKKKTKTNSSLLSVKPSISLSNPCLQNSSSSSYSMTPVSIRYRTSPSPTSTDSYHTPIIDRSPISIIPILQEDKQNILTNIKSQSKKEHDQTIQRYDELLEKMRETDEQLETLSRSWTNNTQERISVKINRESNISLNKMTTNSQFFSPMILQICLIILVIFNLLIAYFFNEINVWWNEYMTRAVIVEQQDQDTLNF